MCAPFLSASCVSLYWNVGGTQNERFISFATQVECIAVLRSGIANTTELQS